MMHTSPTTTAPHAAIGIRKVPGDGQFVDATFFNLFWIFTIASVIGLVGETIAGAIMDGYVKTRFGLVWGPFSPLYGLGALLMTLALNNLKGRSKLLIFVVAGLVGGALEFTAGWFWKSFFGIVAWSYAGQPLNFFGYTCVGMMVVWGLAGLAWVTVGIPLMMRVIGLIPPRARVTVTTILAVFMAADIVVTLMSLNFWFERQAGLPADTPLALFFQQHFGDAWMSRRFGAMTMWANLAVSR